MLWIAYSFRGKMFRESAHTTDEKVARTRAAIIVREGRLLIWDERGAPQIIDARGNWAAYDL